MQALKMKTLFKYWVWNKINHLELIVQPFKSLKKKNNQKIQKDLLLVIIYPIISEIYSYEEDPPCPGDVQRPQKCFRLYEENHRTEAVPIWSDVSEI